MPYAEGRTYYDADSHLMELADWLVQYADPGIRDRIRPLSLGAAGALAERAVSEAVARRGDPTAARDLEGRLMDAKGWAALGAFDPLERSRALDLLGVAKQLVFSTFAATQFIGDDADVLFGGTRAHNRAMAAFCAHDRRLIAVGTVPWGDPERTVAEAREAIRLGCGALLVPSAPSRERSPFHPDYFPLWALLDETGVPFMLHVGGGGRPLRRAFHANGLPPVTDFLGGGENIRSKDFMVLHVPPETFLSCMALDGVFERVWPRVVVIAGVGLLFAPLNLAAFLYIPPQLRAAAVGLLNAVAQRGRERRHLGGENDPGSPRAVPRPTAQREARRPLPAVQRWFEQGREFFMHSTGDPVRAQQMALRSLQELRDRHAAALAYFDVFWASAVVAAMMVFLVLLMRRSVAQKGAHVGAE
jgi:predicted TIM-barrel fold metal-dependent hydrolase